MSRSCVVTGGRGVGRAIAESLLADGDTVVVVHRDDTVLECVSAHPAGGRIITVAGDAADEAVTGQNAEVAESAARLAEWVNNAAVFRDACLDAVPAREVTGLIMANLSLAVTGCATAVRRFWPPGSAGRSSMSPRTRPSGRSTGPCPTRRPRPRSRA